MNRPDRLSLLTCKFAQTWPGKIVVLAAFSAIFFQFYPKLAVHAAIVLTAFTLLPQYRRVILVLANIYFLLFCVLMFSHTRPYSFQSWDMVQALIDSRGLHLAKEGLDNLSNRIILVVSLLGFFWLYLLAAEKIRFVSRHPLLTIYSLFLLLVATASNLKTLPWVSVFLWVFTNWISRAYFYMAYTAADQKFVNEKSRLLRAGTFLPFWNSGWTVLAVVPRGYRGIENTAATNAEDLAACQLSGLKLIAWSWILNWLGRLLSTVQPGLPHRLADYMQTNPTWHERWMTLLGGTLIFLVYYAANTGVVIALVRMAGFRVFRQVYRPYQSRDFNDFLGRIYFYYIDCVVKFFFYPCWRYSRFLSPRKSLRIFATGFCSLTLAGLSATLATDFPGMVEVGLLETLRLAAARSPYFAMIGILVGISSLNSRHRPPGNPSFTRRLMNSALFFVLYSFCWSLQVGYRTDSLRDRAAFVLSLFGIAL